MTARVNDDAAEIRRFLQLPSPSGVRKSAHASKILNVSRLVEQVPQAVFWLVSAVLVEAAVIDGRQLRVPNWLTFHFAAGAWCLPPGQAAGRCFSGRWHGLSRPGDCATARLARASDNVSGHDLGLE